jgi:hypothetical protein
MTEPVQPPSAPPEIRMKILEVDSELIVDGKTESVKRWTLEVMCAVKQGTMQKSIICETYEDLVKSVPIILTQIKEQFYAR